MRRVDALEFPEFSLVEIHGLGVSASQTLSGVRVLEALTITELHIAESKTKGGTEEKTTSHSHVVGVEVSVSTGGLVISESTDSSDGGADNSRGTAKDGVHALSVEELHVEVLGVEFDEVDELDLALHVLVALLHVLFVSNDVGSVSSHFFKILSIN